MRLAPKLLPKLPDREPAIARVSPKPPRMQSKRPTAGSNGGGELSGLKTRAPLPLCQIGREREIERHGDENHRQRLDE